MFCFDVLPAARCMTSTLFVLCLVQWPTNFLLADCTSIKFVRTATSGTRLPQESNMHIDRSAQIGYLIYFLSSSSPVFAGAEERSNLRLHTEAAIAPSIVAWLILCRFRDG